VVKLTTLTFREKLRLVDSEMMCWEATLAAFDVKVQHDECSRSIKWVLEQLTDRGWRYERVKTNTLTGGKVTPTLSVVIPRLIGDWLLILDRHIIAVRDGVITDTAGKERTVKRRVMMAYQLTRPGYPPVRLVDCQCADPLVFGHNYRVNEITGRPRLYCSTIKALMRVNK